MSSFIQTVVIRIILLMKFYIRFSFLSVCHKVLKQCLVNVFIDTTLLENSFDKTRHLFSCMLLLLLLTLSVYQYRCSFVGFEQI